VEQHTLLEAASDTENRNEEKRLHRLATDVVKTYRRSFLNSTLMNATVQFDTDKNKGRAPSLIDEAKLQWLKIFWESVDLRDDTHPNGLGGSVVKTPTMSGLVNNNTGEKISPTANNSSSGIDPDIPTDITPVSTSLTLGGSRRSSLTVPDAVLESTANVLVTTNAQNISFVHRSSIIVNPAPVSPVLETVPSLTSNKGGSTSSLPPLGMSPTK
jgi:hypothetical protein